jgi:hypothetical protein
MSSFEYDDLPSDVRKLLEQCVRSVGHLESLLFLFQNRGRTFSALALSRELRTNEAYAAHQLDELCPYVVEKVGTEFRYAATSENDMTVQKLSDLYRERRHAIINYIYSTPPDALRSFADAFRIKKD